MRTEIIKEEKLNDRAKVPDTFVFPRAVECPHAADAAHRVRQLIEEDDVVLVKGGPIAETRQIVDVLTRRKLAAAA